VAIISAEMKQRGGPTSRDFDKARAFAPDLAAKGDRLLYRGAGKPGEAAKLMEDMCFAIAVLSFVPGGITIFGNHFENKAG
jgi:hypothetical protein